ncbi:MAG: SagB/ThcOx family dehydrogenase [Candidatus Cloacimonetes bacterium]|nr:SagB/ThcOx family dehydrogenase [Candidatus Cloacimonadota bacterium]
MDAKTFGYLYYKTRDYLRADIIREARLTEEEYDFYEENLKLVLEEIYRDRVISENIGGDFVRLTRYIYDRISDQESGKTRPDAIKTRSGEIVSLPAVGAIEHSSMSLSQAISQRRSLRKYAPGELSAEELSWLLWSCSWARDFRSNERMEITLRNVPSAGARHPFECYLMVRKVKGIKPGLYYYHPVKHCLVLINENSEVFAKIEDGCFNQEMVTNAPVTFIWTAVPYRTAWRYGQRGYRYLYLDAGHVGQNLHLAAEAIEGGACMIGAYLDELMNEILEVDGVNEFVIYIAAVGKKQEK